MRRKLVSVVGYATPEESEACMKQAYALGRGLVDSGYRVLTGGLGGVMEAALAGAKASERYREGDTLAIVSTFDPADANEYADIVIATGMDVYINGIVANSDAVVAIGGGAGTLCEIAIALQEKRPLFAYVGEGGSSRLAAEICGGDVLPVNSVEEVLCALQNRWSR